VTCSKNQDGFDKILMNKDDWNATHTATRTATHNAARTAIHTATRTATHTATRKYE